MGTLRLGDKGDAVRAVQDVLNFHIRRLVPLKVDGQFGSATQARVIEFQQSNGLQVDGIVGNQTAQKLFETEEVPFSLGIIPSLLLTPPTLGSGGPTQAPGIQPPVFIPPLTLPGFGPLPTQPPLIPGQLPVPVIMPFQLFPSSISALPALNPQGQVLNLKFTVPLRNDPRDPAIASFQQIVSLLETLPPNFPFRAAIIGAVPRPKTIIGPLGIGPAGDLNSGFKWGIDPLFDLKKLAGPTEFGVGVKGNASYVFRIISQSGPNGLKVGIFAKGDFKGELDYTSQKAESRPQFQMDGTIMGGIVGRF